MAQNGYFDEGNLLLLADSYKVTHHLQYPEGTTIVYSYFESRGGKFDEICFFGLQYILKKWLVGQVITAEKIAEAKQIFIEHLSNPHVFNEDGWNYILNVHNGCLPVRIKAVPEGTVVPCKNILFSVENTDPHCYWLTNYLETLLVQVWYPMTVATNSREQKKILMRYMVDTADNLLKLPYQLHDFGFRGSTSVESAGIGGLSHLVNFEGTDTIAAIVTGRNYYHCNMAGQSIPATEHSTITTWGKNGELEAFRNILTKFPTGMVACVSDSYDIFNACETMWGEQLRDLIVERQGTLVIRPDSGDPADTVVKVLEILGRKFGTTVNSKGYKELPKCLRLIQGDGISYETLGGILGYIKERNWSAENLTFGSGGALLQRLDRDTQKCAYKCSYAVVNGNEVNVFKSPITDPGKNSKKGRLSLECHEGKYTTIQEGKGDPTKDILTTVFENGRLVKDYTLAEIRARANLNLI